MGIDSFLYRIVLVVHIATAAVGIGGLIAHGAYHAAAFRAALPSAAATILGTAVPARRTAEWALYGVAPTGIVLVAFSDDTWAYEDLWVVIGLVSWLAIISAVHAAVRPAVTTMVERAEALAADAADDPTVTGATPLDADEAARAGAGRLVVGELAVQVLAIVAVVAMIWKPLL